MDEKGLKRFAKEHGMETKDFRIKGSGPIKRNKGFFEITALKIIKLPANVAALVADLVRMGFNISRDKDNNIDAKK